MNEEKNLVTQRLDEISSIYNAYLQKRISYYELIKKLDPIIKKTKKLIISISDNC